MSALERLACQAILVGFDGTSLDPELAAQLASARFAGYLLFARNTTSVAQTRALTDALRALHPPELPPLLGLDQEGGRVVRLRDGVEAIPPMMSVGAADDAGLARRAGVQTAHDVRRAGFSIDFAPVLDLALDPANTVIGTRSFGCDPVRVAALGGAFGGGLRDGGVVATYKHFPGHGSTATDSHVELPTIDLDEATLRARDLAPFAALAPEALAYMSAHVVMRAIDPDRPATLSHRVLTDLLRGELDFRGVCFTDCMQMGAIARNGTAQAVVAAIVAGADCALVSHDPSLALSAAREIVKAVESGALSVPRLESAVTRIAHLRSYLRLPLPLDDAPPFAGIGRKIARRAITLVRGQGSAIASESIVVSFQSETTEGAQGVHEEHPSLSTHRPSLMELRVPLEPSATDIRDLRAAILESGRRPVVLSRRAHVYPDQAQAIGAVLSDRPDALVISLREPFDLALFPQAQHAVAAYGDDSSSIGGVSDMVFGALPLTGRLPIRL